MISSGNVPIRGTSDRATRAPRGVVVARSQASGKTTVVVSEAPHSPDLSADFINRDRGGSADGNAPVFDRAIEDSEPPLWPRRDHLGERARSGAVTMAELFPIVRRRLRRRSCVARLARRRECGNGWLVPNCR
jgi:hypothetical protein